MSRTRSILLVVSAALLVGACSGADEPLPNGDAGAPGPGGGDAGETDAGTLPPLPEITLFTATPGSFEPGGGTVTLAWEVEGADALELSPHVGDVTGLAQKEVTIEATTTFTLTANNDHGASTATVTVKVAVPTVTVSGTVFEKVGQPAAGIRVLIPGHPVVTTDADGRFSVPEVEVPYDLVFDLAVPVVFVGVTRADPMLLISGTLPTPPPATLSGTVSSPGSNKAFVVYDADNARAYTRALDTSWNTSAYFETGAATATGTLWGFIVQTDPNNHITDYLAVGTTPGVTAFPGGSTQGLNVSVTSPITQTASLNGTFDLPNGFTPTSMTYSAGLRFPQRARWSIASTVDVPMSGAGAGSFTRKIPVLDGITATLDAFAMNADFMLFLWRTGLTPQTSSNLQLEMPAPFTGMKPASGESVSAPITLDWNGDQGVYLGQISKGFPISFRTNRTEFTVPDLSPLGITLPSTETPLRWSVTGRRGSVDALLSAEGNLPPEDGDTSVVWNGADVVFTP